ncbi:MAG: helix-turn-helix transcriptional regulator [Polyangiaceae bacterium]|nr:helix-turn-helix transcriptional regulator [Polyangiaceae bacterium]
MNDVSRSPFGQQLRHWRSRAGMSQLALATEAGTTPRHLSFIETGRSRPGADLVLRLATALDIPIRERNALLVAAGLPAAYPALSLEDDAMKPVQRVLERVLASHEPYPAWVGSRGFRFISSNRAAEALFPGLCSMSPEAIIDLWFGPGPFREIVDNWPDVVWAGVASLRREAMRASDPALTALWGRADRHAKTIPAPGHDAHPELPVVCPRLNIGGRRVRTISMVMRFDTAAEVTASELKVELMFPADDDSERFFRELAVSR